MLLILLFRLQVVLPVLKDIEAKHSKAGLGAVSSAITTITLEYVAAMCSTLIQVKNFDIEDWETVRPPCYHIRGSLSPKPANLLALPWYDGGHCVGCVHQHGLVHAWKLHVLRRAV